eukprot:SAG11_NODE_2276_length_3583_cov_2.156429_1_plen_135_part_10
MASFYRRFISDFAGLARPLAELLKKDVDVQANWKQEHTDAVRKIKQALTTYPVLRQYDIKKPVFLVTDASDVLYRILIFVPTILYGTRVPYKNFEKLIPQNFACSRLGGTTLRKPYVKMIPLSFYHRVFRSPIKF